MTHWNQPMAHLAVVIDDSPERQDRFLTAVRRLFDELPGVTVGER